MSSPSSSSPKQASIQGLRALTRQVRRSLGLAATFSPFSDETHIEEDKGDSNRKPSSSSSSQPSRAPTQPSSVYCKICMESVSVSESFTTGICSHAFCSECIRHHIAAKVEENCGAVSCPEQGCPTVLDPQLCQFIVPFEVFVRWGKILCEGSIGEPLKFYCSYKDCSALLLDEGKVVIREAECPHCHRLFCAQCRTPWHSGIDCAEFQKLGKHEREKEDIMLRSLAKDRKWGRCPRCGYYVERVSGCSYIVCR